MTKNFKVKKCNLCFVLRHRFEKIDGINRTFMRWQICLWFNKSKIVGSNNFSDHREWRNNHVNSYMLGIELLFFKTWFTIDFGGMHLSID